MWLTAHFLFWDYSQTRAAERFSVNGVIQYLGNKDLAVFNQFAVWGSVRMCLMLKVYKVINSFIT